ncbi:MAG: hypothetical protein V3S69_08010 [Dehalococcoidales bacterium]
MNVPITETDNRDSGTTWLWISWEDYIEVNPVELINNVIENCEPWLTEEAGITPEELKQVQDILARF